MRLKLNIATILKRTSGQSLVFVLGIMLLLMAVGVSVMTAASSNVGAYRRQYQYSRAVIFGDSIQRNIMYSLQEDPADESLLSNQLVWLIYEADGKPDDVDLDIDIDGIDLMIQHSITLQFPHKDVRTTGPVNALPEVNIDRIPKTARINAGMIVTVVIEIESIGEEDRLITSQATYIYKDGLLTDDPEGNYITENPPEDEILEMQFAPGEFGTWSLVGYEIVES